MTRTVDVLFSLCLLGACTSFDGSTASQQVNPGGSGVLCQDIRSAISRSACEQRVVQENRVRLDWQEQVRERQERDARIAAIRAAREAKEAKEARDPGG